MNKTHMVSFRLDASTFRKINLLRIARHRSRGQILREAIDLYFRAHVPAPVARPDFDEQLGSGRHFLRR
jgi:Ribbon-helix-helix protein, copG family